MGAYPREPQSPALKAILAPLIETKDVPYPVLVATSNNWDAMDFIGAEDSSEGFGEVVKILGKRPSQFAGDFFGELRALERVIPGEKLSPTR